jgi:uncharacterized membrane protein YccC
MPKPSPTVDLSIPFGSWFSVLLGIVLACVSVTLWWPRRR